MFDVFLIFHRFFSGGRAFVSKPLGRGSTFFGLGAQSVGLLLKDLGRERSLERLCEFSGPASAGSWPGGLAVDILHDGSAGRVKIYFRSAAVDA